MVFFFVLLLESRNFIAETEIIAERVFFFSTRDTPSLWSILGDLSMTVRQEGQNEVLTQEASCFNDLNSWSFAMKKLFMFDP